MWLHTTPLSHGTACNAIFDWVNMVSRMRGIQRIALPNADEVS
jgi:hypothetical protein